MKNIDENPVILGLHGFSSHSSRQMHDAGICIMHGGKVLAAIDEERLTRKKRDGRFPFNAIDVGLKTAGITSSDITDIAFVDKKIFWQTMYVWKYALLSFLRTGVNPWAYLLFWTKQMRNYRRLVPGGMNPNNVCFYEHHLCHAASAYYPCPWPEATIVSLDGMGDFSIGGMVAYGKDGNINILKRSNGYFSPGHFYMILTEYLGFIPGLHEGKVTGLAAYGNAQRAYHTMEKIIKILPQQLDFVAPLVAEEFFNVIRSKPNARTRQWHSQHNWNSSEMPSSDMPQKPCGLHKFKELWSSFSPADIAAAGQSRFENVICEYVRDSIALTGCRRVAVAGGCFANVRLNQKIMELPEVTDLYVHPNMGDGGLSAGAAMLHYYRKHSKNKKYEHAPWPNIYLGPSYSLSEIAEALHASGLVFNKPRNVANKAAQFLASGKIVAWFQGRMEYGPRALGNRSLLASASDSGMTERLNKRLERTDFMPFAPIILEEYAADWIEGWEKEHIISRFMTATYNINPSKRGLVPAVVHVDGTARPQVIKQSDNSALHETLQYYYSLTGIPLVINTSFNMHGEPIVCTPKDAVSSFKQGAGDVLIIGPYAAVLSNSDVL